MPGFRNEGGLGLARGRPDTPLVSREHSGIYGSQINKVSIHAPLTRPTDPKSFE